MKKVYKKYRVANVFMLVIFVALLFSCEKNIKTLEESNNGQLFEQESIDDNKSNEDKLLTDDSGELLVPLKERTPGLAYDDSNEWKGTGYNPEGPSGVESKTPPSYLYD